MSPSQTLALSGTSSSVTSSHQAPAASRRPHVLPEALPANQRPVPSPHSIFLGRRRLLVPVPAASSSSSSTAPNHRRTPSENALALHSSVAEMDDHPVQLRAYASCNANAITSVAHSQAADRPPSLSFALLCSGSLVPPSLASLHSGLHCATTHEWDAIAPRRSALASRFARS